MANAKKKTQKKSTKAPKTKKKSTASKSSSKKAVKKAAPAKKKKPAPKSRAVTRKKSAKAPARPKARSKSPAAKKPAQAAKPKKAAPRTMPKPKKAVASRAKNTSPKNKAPEKFVLPPLPQRPTPTYTPMKQMPDVMMVPKSSAEASGKKRYSDAELKEFQEIILAKLADARKELNNLQASLLNANDHGTDDTATTFKMLEDGSDSMAKEEAGQLAARQRKFIDQLENALVRIENKTYGICRVTGKLIPKERLRAVPHTTQSIEAKMQQYRD